jgi:outer membrane protein
VAIALRDNRDVLIKAADVKKARLKLQEAEAGLFPTLTLTGSLTDTIGFYSKDISQASAQASVKQYIYKGGKTINTIRYNGYNLEVTKSLLDKAKLELALTVKQAFYTLLLSAQLTELNRKIVENTSAHLELVKERYKKGEASESEVLGMQASLSNVQKAYEESLNQEESAENLLATILFLEKNAKVKPEGSFTYAREDLAFDTAFLKAMKTRPEIKQYEAQEERDKKSIEIAKADNRPSVYASWDYYSRSHQATGTAKNWNDYQVVGLTFSWPLFDGWAAKARVEQSIVDLTQTRLNKQKTVADLALELKDAYLSLKNAIALLQSSEDDIRVFQDNLSKIKEQYAKGIASTLHVDDAAVQYTIALFNKDQGVYEYMIAKAAFDKATGGL